MKRLLATLAICTTMFVSCAPEQTVQENITYEISLGKVPKTAVFKNGDDTTWSVWGASMAKGDDGLYHIFYSRWPKALGWSWVVDSEIAHATSASPYGPWEFQDISLPRRGKEYWDGWCTHNPTIQKIDGKYYLYYMGNTGDGEVTCKPDEREVINWQHRNNQRIGVAVANSPYGPWTRFDEPLIDITDDPEAYDCLMTSNPSVCQRPDGGMLYVYKAVSTRLPLPNGGPVVHMAATSDSPTGKVTKAKDLVFHYEGERFAAEDPYIWYADGKYRAIVKRIKEGDGKRLFSLMHFQSDDGFDWIEAPYKEVSALEITWEDGKYQKLEHLERPQVYIEDGEPMLLLCAADTLEGFKRHSFNVQIPLNLKKHVVQPEEKE
ncbi:MAG: glycoside hydrolase family protein [Rikenellaceae bacterium]